MKNFLTFLLLAVIVVVVIVLIKKPKADDAMNGGGATATMEEGSPMVDDPNMIGGDAAVNVEFGGQGDTTQQ